MTSILTPTIAHRLPRTGGADCVVAKLLEFQINASAFLMDAEQLSTLKNEGFINDFDRAFEDFFYQIPVNIRGKVFPLEPEPEAPATSPEVPSDGSGAIGQQKAEPPSQRHGLSF